MNTLKILVITLLLSSFANSNAFASLSEPTTPTVTANKKIQITFSSKVSDEIEFKLSDLQGTVLVRETVESGTTKRVYDLKRLPSGIYYIQYGTKELTTFETLSIDEKEITILESFNVKEPKIFHHENKLVISALPFGEKMKIELLNNNDDYALYSETLSGENSYSRKFDLSQLPSGLYLAKIKISKKAFTNYIMVD